MRVPVGFYKKNGKTRPISARKNRGGIGRPRGKLRIQHLNKKTDEEKTKKEIKREGWNELGVIAIRQNFVIDNILKTKDLVVALTKIVTGRNEIEVEGYKIRLDDL